MLNAILLTLTVFLHGQIGQTFGNNAMRSAGQSILEQVADKQLSEIVSNAPDRITANKPFTLLIVYDPRSPDQTTQWLTRALQAPQSAELMRWIGQCDVRGVSIDSPHAEKLRWHIEKHQQLPILLLQESPGSGTGEGSTWFSCGGAEIPLNESQLAAELQRWYVATKNAKPSGTLDGLPSPQFSPQYPDNYVIPRRSSNAFTERRPLINPKIDIDIPDSINTKVEASLRPDTLRGLVIGGFVLLAASLSIAYAMIHSARIIGEAITDDPSQNEVTHGS
jgi:hypothetical protein